VEAAVNASLKRLQLDYLDLYLIHFMWPGVDYGDGTELPKILSPPTHVIWKNMEEQVKKGKIRSIGISNASVPVLLDLLAGCEIPPAVNQIEAHPYFQQNDLINFHRKFNIQIQSYAAICRGSNLDWGKAQKKDLNILTDPVITEIAQKHGRTPAQVCINWAIQRKTIPLIKTVNLDRLTENFNSFDF